MSGLLLDKIDKRFGSVVALSDVRLEIAHGQFVCLLGPSGCGKTTLLRIVAGLEAPSAGRVLLDAEDITEQPVHKRGFRHGVPVPRALPAPDGRREHRLRPEGSRPGEAGAGGPGGGASGTGAPAGPGVAAYRPAFRRAAAAGRDRPGPGPEAQAVPARRAAFGPGRQAARGDADRAAPAPAAARHHHHRGDPRSARGHDHGRPRGGHGRQPGSSRRARRWTSTAARSTASWPTSSAPAISCRAVCAAARWRSRAAASPWPRWGPG